MNKIIRLCSKIIGLEQEPLSSIYSGRTQMKGMQIDSDTTVIIYIHYKTGHVKFCANIHQTH